MVALCPFTQDTCMQEKCHLMTPEGCSFTVAAEYASMGHKKIQELQEQISQLKTGLTEVQTAIMNLRAI